MDESAPSTELVVLEAGEDLKDAVCTWGEAFAVFGVQRQRRNAALGHGPSQVPFEEGLDQEDDEIEEEEGFDGRKLSSEMRQSASEICEQLS